MSETTRDHTPRPNPYLRNAVLTASPEQLQLMLYDGAIRFTREGREALTRKDYEQAYHKLTRAQHIMLEMYNGLNFEVNPSLCEKIGGLYMFIYRRLVDGNAHHDLSALDDALKILDLERQTWRMLIDKITRGEDSPGGAPPPPSGAGDSYEPGRLSIEC